MSILSLRDGTKVALCQIALVQPDKMDWCKVTLLSGESFECQDYERINNALEQWLKQVEKSNA